MTDAPLLVLLSGLAALVFRRRGDRWPVALGKGGAVGFLAVALLAVVLAVTAGGAARRGPGRPAR